MKAKRKVWKFIIYSHFCEWRLERNEEWAGTQRIYRSYSFGPFMLRVFDRCRGCKHEGSD